MSLAGRSSEHIARNAGEPHRVVRLCALSEDVFAWVGYRENWQKQGTEQSFRFFDAGFTVHVGRVGELAKPQLLRSEWVSPHDGGFTNRAGHPHWQLDVLESIRARPVQPPARFDAVVPDARAQEFESSPAPPAQIDILLGLTIERMHLASAALWWQKPSAPVAHRAETVDDLNRWVLACIAYLRQEMERCVIVQA